MKKFMCVNFKCPCNVVDLFLLHSLVYTYINFKIHQKYEFVIYTSSQSGNERWQLMSKLVQFACAFIDLIPNSYDNLNNMKLDLNVSTPRGQSILAQITRTFRLSLQIVWLQGFFKCFFLYILKGTHLGICRNGIFCMWARLFIFLDSYLPMWLFKILPNVRSTINSKKAQANL